MEHKATKIVLKINDIHYDSSHESRRSSVGMR